MSAGEAVLILAAGHGRRMGGPKLFREHGGRTFLERILQRCRENRSTIVLVVDSRFRVEAEGLLSRIGAPALTLAEADGNEPMLSSIQGGLKAAPAFGAGFWLWPVDAPFLSAAGWARAREAVRSDPGSIWKLRAGGRTGHPIWLPGWSVPLIRAGIWPNGLLGFLAGQAARTRQLPLDDELISDFNTPESLAAVPESI